MKIPCKFVKKYGKCKYAHNVEELRVKQCKFNKRCIHGRHCRFKHDYESLENYYRRQGFTNYRSPHPHPTTTCSSVLSRQEKEKKLNETRDEQKMEKGKMKVINVNRDRVDGLKKNIWFSKNMNNGKKMRSFRDVLLGIK